MVGFVVALLDVAIMAIYSGVVIDLVASVLV